MIRTGRKLSCTSLYNQVKGDIEYNINIKLRGKIDYLINFNEVYTWDEKGDIYHIFYNSGLIVITNIIKQECG
jgi:hypothetical protein